MLKSSQSSSAWERTKDGVSSLVMSSHSEINNLILKNKQVTIKMDANDVFFFSNFGGDGRLPHTPSRIKSDLKDLSVLL